MFRPITFSLVLLAGTPGVVGANGVVNAPAPMQLASSAPTPADDEAIRSLVRRYVDARETQDRAAVEALFTPDADQLVSSGEWRRGRTAVVTGSLASSANTGGTRTIEIETIRMIGPDIAMADGRYEIGGTGGQAPRRMWTSFVVVRDGPGWRIAAIRNMLPAAAAPTAPR